MAGALKALTKDQKEFIVRMLATFHTPRDVAVAFSGRFAVSINENDVLANDPRINIVDPDLHILFRTERERAIDDPHSAPMAEQKVRLIVLSRQVERYESNNQPAEARAVLRQIAEEMGTIGAGKSAKAATEKDTPRQITEIVETIVDPAAPAPPPPPVA